MTKTENRSSLYAEVTSRIIAELEQGRLPWVQPWDASACGCAMPANAVSGRRYSGINALILWAAVIVIVAYSACLRILRRPAGQTRRAVVAPAQRKSST